MPDWLLLTLGGAIGTNARYWLGRWITAQPWSDGFPWGTFAINVTGSMLLALLAVLLPQRATGTQRDWYLLLGVGLCGGYTTFSTFSLEAWQLIERQRYVTAALYVVGSVAIGVLAVGAIMRLRK